MRVAARALTIGATLVLLAATPAAAIRWRTPVLLHPSSEELVVDAAFNGPDTAVTWFERDADDGGHLGLAGVLGGGTGPVHGYTIEDAVDRAEVAVCDGDAWIAWVKRDADGRGELVLAKISLGGNGIETVSIATGMRRFEALDVACGAGRAWVAWTQRTGGSWHALLRSVLLADLSPDTTIDLGHADDWAVSVDATAGRAVVGWVSPGEGARITRLSVGAAPGYPVTSRPAQSLAPGGFAPLVALDGPRVAAGYTAGNDAWIRLSSDGGATFGPARKLAENGRDEEGGELSAGFASLDVRGSRAVATIMVQWPPVPVYHRLRTSDFGGHWSVAELGIHARWDGFLATPDGTRIGEISMRTGWWDEPQRWDVTFRRQR
jgi:hypothetical protein